MVKLISFTFVTLNGYFKGPQGDISWHKDNDPEKNDYANKGLDSDSTLIFGRITYEMMASFWPSPDAMKFNPKMAEGMNNADKIVFSRTLKKANWKNTKLVNGDMIEETKKLKKTSSKNLAIMGSGSIITQLAEHNLIDQYQLMVDPVVIGNGTPIFNNIKGKLDLKLVDSKIFKSGVVLLTYEQTKE
jgi:dihydrofolate reductase